VSIQMKLYLRFVSLKLLLLQQFMKWLYYLEYKTHIFHIFYVEKLRCVLNSRKLFTRFQTVHGVAWEEPDVNTFGVSHQATSPPDFQFSHCLTFLLFRCVQFSISLYPWKSVLHMMLHSKEKLLFFALKR
jgi:hypothetical protein